jgi:3-methylfumaryl-CoA hydratase
MWAGGRLTFHAPLRIGEMATRETETLSIADKAGKQGALLFLTLRHLLSNKRGLAITEEQDIVYREPSVTARPPPAAGELAPAQWRGAVTPDPTLWFRYSAVTFNAHRIHYDLPYATGAEGYPALVVQCPLTAPAYSFHSVSPRPRSHGAVGPSAPTRKSTKARTFAGGRRLAG